MNQLSEVLSRFLRIFPSLMVERISDLPRSSRNGMPVPGVLPLAPAPRAERPARILVPVIRTRASVAAPVDVANFVQEQRSLISQLKPAEFLVNAPSSCPRSSLSSSPPGIASQLTLTSARLFRWLRAYEWHARPVPVSPKSRTVIGSCDHFDCCRTSHRAEPFPVIPSKPTIELLSSSAPISFSQDVAVHDKTSKRVVKSTAPATRKPFKTLPRTHYKSSIGSQIHEVRMESEHSIPLLASQYYTE